MTFASDRWARRVESRAMRRNASAARTTIGLTARTINARKESRKNNSTMMKPTSSTWLTRLTVRVTTVAKSSVSEVTRLTILPEGSRRRRTCPARARRRTRPGAGCSTTSPTTMAREPTLDEVEHPAQHAGDQHCGHQVRRQSQPFGRSMIRSRPQLISRGSAAWFSDCATMARRDECHQPELGPEVAEDPAEQSTVASRSGRSPRRRDPPR